MGAEHKDMILSWGHLYLTYNEKCVEPPGEAISNNDIFRKLAKLMGYNDEQFSWNDDECLENYVDWDSPLARYYSDYLKENGFARLKVGTKMIECRTKMVIFRLLQASGVYIKRRW